VEYHVLAALKFDLVLLHVRMDDLRSYRNNGNFGFFGSQDKGKMIQCGFARTIRTGYLDRNAGCSAGYVDDASGLIFKC